MSIIKMFYKNILASILLLVTFIISTYYVSLYVTEHSNYYLFISISTNLLFLFSLYIIDRL